MKKFLFCMLGILLIFSFVGCGGGSSKGGGGNNPPNGGNNPPGGDGPETPPSWKVVGSAGFSAGPVFNTLIAIDKTGVPFVVYRDEGNSLKATVMKFDGTNWTTVGSVGFSAGPAVYTSIAN